MPALGVASKLPLTRKKKKTQWPHPHFPAVPAATIISQVCSLLTFERLPSSQAILLTKASHLILCLSISEMSYHQPQGEALAFHRL